MKPLIVSFGIIILSVLGLTYQSDFTNYYLLEQNLQALTEECTAYAALNCYDEETEKIVFDADICRSCVQTMINYAVSNMPCFSKDNGTVRIVNLSAYEGESNYLIKLKLAFTPQKSFFRLKSIKTSEISHESCYEWLIEVYEIEEPF